ncbi:hypothetical protein [Paenibacillus dokdonensis]|uniref:hypothetical protein n=1 Tax=Paenibacillus dokdonensis TaxID=2567944 RepID=UPI0010A8D296|nr:hypothetical protein [Paenibacillus dokdonensis]
MRNRKWLLAMAAVMVLGGAFYMNSISAESPTDKIQVQLLKQGVTISDISAKEENLKLATLSASNSGEATIEDIKAIRKIRNEVRSRASDASQIKNIDLTIIGANGATIYNGVSNDITKIPDFSHKIEGSLDLKTVQSTVYDELKKNGVAVDSVNVSNNELGGKLASIVLTAEISEVNSLVPKIEQWITSLNDSRDAGISQYDLTINDKNNSNLLYLTTDLVYRDFYWWQSPALGNDVVWTKSGPESEESAASEDKVPATFEEGIIAGPSGTSSYEGPQFKK